MRLSVLVPAALLSLAPLACGPSAPNPNDPSQAQNQYGAQGQYGQQPPGQYGQMGGQPGQYQQPGQYGQQPGAPAQPGVPTQPAAPTGPAPAQPAAAGGQATPIAAAALTPALTLLASQETQGMQPEGSAFAGQFQDGQTLEQTFNIAPGKCYAVVAAGLGIQEVHIQLAVALPPPLPNGVVAQDNGSSGPGMSSLGGKGTCWKNPAPFGGPGKAIIKVRGQGVAAAQIFSK